MDRNIEYQNNIEFEKKWLVSEDLDHHMRCLDESIEVFNKTLEAIEARCYDPNENSESLLDEITKAIVSMMYGCEMFERGVKNKDIIKETQVKFREKTNRIISKSYCMNRVRTWPQGQQGDYKTLEVAYRKEPLSKGIGYYLDHYLLNEPLGDAVRNRIIMLEEILRKEITQRQNPCVLNIACGSCRELMGLAPEIIESKARVTCIDNDDDALFFSVNRLSHTGVLPQIKFYKYNALRLFDYELAMMEIGKQDIIYSVGFFDYLPTDFLIKMLGTLYSMLNTGGTLIAAFKDADKYKHQDFHWLVDWDGFLQRTEPEFEDILAQAGIPSSAISLKKREESGLIIFYLISKNR